MVKLKTERIGVKVAKVKDVVSDPNYYDHYELAFPPEWATKEQVDELVSWMERMLKHAGELAQAEVDEQLMKVKETLEWITKNCDTGFLYTGQRCGVGLGEDIRKKAEDALALLHDIMSPATKIQYVCSGCGQIVDCVITKSGRCNPREEPSYDWWEAEGKCSKCGNKLFISDSNI